MFYVAQCGEVANLRNYGHCWEGKGRVNFFALMLLCKEKLKALFFPSFIFLGCIPTPEGKKYYFILKKYYTIIKHSFRSLIELTFGCMIFILRNDIISLETK